MHPIFAMLRINENRAKLAGKIFIETNAACFIFLYSRNK